MSDVWFNDGDGWYYCSGIIWDEKALDPVINKGWSVSCTYDFESDNTKKKYNGQEITQEFTNGKFLHLAIVPDPRYERANIVFNAKDGGQDNTVDNADRWITVHPNGDDNKGRPLFIKDGESVKEAIDRQYHKKEENKSEVETNKKQDTTANETRQQRIEQLIKQADNVSVFDSGSIEKRTYEKSIKQIEELDLLSDDEKKDIKDKLLNYHEGILTYLAKSPSSYAVGPARYAQVVGTKGRDNYQKATNLMAERDNYIATIQDNIRKQKTKQDYDDLTAKGIDAFKKGLMEFEHNGEIWFRPTKRSKSYIALDKYSQAKYDKYKNSVHNYNENQKRDERGQWTKDDALIQQKKDNLVPIEVNSEDIPKFESKEDLGEWFTNIFKNLRSVTIDDTGINIDLYKSNAERKASKRRLQKEENKAVAQAFKDVVEKSIKVDERTADERHKHNQDIYYNKLKLGDDKYDVDIFVDYLEKKRCLSLCRTQCYKSR